MKVISTLKFYLKQKAQKNLQNIFYQNLRPRFSCAKVIVGGSSFIAEILKIWNYCLSFLSSWRFIVLIVLTTRKKMLKHLWMNNGENIRLMQIKILSFPFIKLRNLHNISDRVQKKLWCRWRQNALRVVPWNFEANRRPQREVFERTSGGAGLSKWIFWLDWHGKKKNNSMIIELNWFYFLNKSTFYIYFNTFRK